MHSLSPAFATPTSLTLTGRRTTLINTRCRSLRVTTSRRLPLVRMAEETEQEEVSVSAAEILKTMREESTDVVKRDDGTRSGRNMLGVYRDVDGKSNIWAVEPTEETDTNPQISKATIIAVAAAFITAALLLLPLLPFTNPDQL